MKRVFVAALCLACAASPALLRAQESTPPAPPAPAAVDGMSAQEIQENFKSLNGKIQDMMDAREAQGKRLQDLAHEISDLRDQVSKPAGNFATADDLKRLTDAIEEIDKKREADKELILKQLEKLGKAVGAPTTHIKSTPPPADPGTAPKSGGDEPGYTYQIKSGDTLLLISQAYKEQGIKVSVSDILNANPGLNPKKLYIGQKINIPAKGAVAKAN